MLVRALFGASVAFMAITGLAACSSGSPSAPTVPVAAHCKVNGNWRSFPSNFRADSIAQVLGVTETDVRSGSFGSVACDTEVSEDAIASTTPPLVSVADQGTTCMALGTQSAPQAGASTKKILAVCPGKSGSL